MSDLDEKRLEGRKRDRTNDTMSDFNVSLYDMIHQINQENREPKVVESTMKK